MSLKIAIIGSRGIPAKYGGFETFTEEISKRLVSKGYEIYVSCEGGITPRISKYNGVNLFYFPLKPFCRVIYETVYDIYSLIKSSLLCDYIYVLGYGAGFFFFIPKLFGRKLFVNVDGIEWKRDKYNKVEKIILFLGEIFAVHFSDIVIADSIQIKKYIEAEHGKNTAYISYGVEQPPIELWNPDKLREVYNYADLQNNSYYLVVARLEPENNIHIIVEGFLLSNSTKKLVIVGNFLSQKYKDSIDKIIQEFNGNDRIIFTGGIYKKDLLNMLRQNCFVYIHGHSAGGTNPSLLEAMIMKNIIIADANMFNMEVGSNTILTFKGVSGLKAHIENIDNNYPSYLKFKENAYKRVLTYYSWEDVAAEYISLFKNESSGLITRNQNNMDEFRIYPQKSKMPVFSDLIDNSLSFPEDKKGGTMKTGSLVSIIIPTYNSEKTLGKCLQSIQNQTYHNIEIIIVDGESKDGTVSLAKKYGAKVIKKKAGMSESTNIGIDNSKGEYIYRVDSDVILDNDIVEKCVRKCEIEGYDGVAVFWSPDPTISFWARVRKLEKDCYKDNLFPRGARFFKKQVINSIGGFNASLTSGEDYDVYNRLLSKSFKIGQIDSQETHIGEPKSILDIMRKQYKYGLSIKEFFKCHPKNGFVQVNPFRRELIQNWKRFLRHPILTLGFILYEFVVYSAATFGFIVSILKGQLNRSESKQ